MGSVTLGTLYASLKKEIGANEALILIRHFTGFSRTDIAVHPQTAVEQAMVCDLKSAVARRKDNEPLQYIIGSWEFYGREFAVGEGVLIPRQDTETLCDKAISNAPHGAKVLDLCAGSGCISVTIKAERPDLTVYAVEKYPKAFEYLKKNIAENKVDVNAFMADALCPNEFSGDFCNFDLMVSNPPYLTSDDMDSLQKEVEFEPKTALFGGENGLEFYEKLTQIWESKLKPGGVLMYEVGADQSASVEKILLCNGFKNVCHKRDLCGIIRVVYAFK